MANFIYDAKKESQSSPLTNPTYLDAAALKEFNIEFANLLRAGDSQTRYDLKVVLTPEKYEEVKHKLLPNGDTDSATLIFVLDGEGKYHFDVSYQEYTTQISPEDIDDGCIYFITDKGITSDNLRITINNDTNIIADALEVIKEAEQLINFIKSQS